MLALAWPVAFVLVALASIRAAVVLADGRRAERMASQDRNTRFLAAERHVDDEVKRIRACAEARSAPTSLSQQIEEMITIVTTGHDPECSYCSCGFSKESKALIDIAPLLAKRLRDAESRMKMKLRSEGWSPPPDEGVLLLTEGSI